MNWVVFLMLCGCLADHALGAGLKMCLRKMGETDLAVSATNIFSFRFTILPTRRGNPVSIRIEREGTALKLVAKRLAGQAGYEIGDLIETKARVLSAEEAKEIFKGAGKLGFFYLPATEEDELVVADADRWFLESSQRGRFHMVERRSPTVDAKKRGLIEFVKFCGLLVKYSNLEEPPSAFKNAD